MYNNNNNNNNNNDNNNNIMSSHAQRVRNQPIFCCVWHTWRLFRNNNSKFMFINYGRLYAAFSMFRLNEPWQTYDFIFNACPAFRDTSPRVGGSFLVDFDLYIYTDVRVERICRPLLYYKRTASLK